MCVCVCVCVCVIHSVYVWPCPPHSNNFAFVSHRYRRNDRTGIVSSTTSGNTLTHLSLDVFKGETASVVFSLPGRNGLFQEFGIEHAVIRTGNTSRDWFYCENLNAFYTGMLFQ